MGQRHKCKLQMAAMRVNMPWYDSDPDTNAENTVTIDACMPQLAIFAKPKTGKPRVNTVHNVVITSKSRKEVEKNTARSRSRDTILTHKFTKWKKKNAPLCAILSIIDLNRAVGCFFRRSEHFSWLLDLWLSSCWKLLLARRFCHRRADRLFDLMLCWLCNEIDFSRVMSAEKEKPRAPDDRSPVRRRKDRRLLPAQLLQHDVTK